MIPKMLFGPCAVLDGYMYFFTFGGGIFTRMDLATGVVELLETTFDCIFGKYSAAVSMMAVDRNIYVLTGYGRYLAEYCVDTAQANETEIGCYYCQRQCDFVVFRRTGRVRKWRVNMYSL